MTDVYEFASTVALSSHSTEIDTAVAQVSATCHTSRKQPIDITELKIVSLCVQKYNPIVSIPEDI